jgi:hypothetical protein
MTLGKVIDAGNNQRLGRRQILRSGEPVSDWH